MVTYGSEDKPER